MKNGFVLIEIVTYIGLFTILLGGLFLCALQLYESASNTEAQITAQEEINFVLKKIDWLFSGAEIASIDIDPDEVTLDKFNFTDNPITIRLNGLNAIEMEIDGEIEPLTTENVDVENLSFNFDGSTKILKANFTINGTDAQISRLLKI